MPKATRFYRKKLTATATPQVFDFEGQGIRLSELSVLNAGSNNAIVDRDIGISTDSPLLPVRVSIKLGADALNFKYKTTSGTTILYLTGMRHGKV